MANPIKYSELFDVDGLVSALSRLEEAERQFSTQASKDLTLLQKTAAQLRVEMEKLVVEFDTINLTTEKGRAEFLKLEKESNKTIKAFKEQSESIRANKQILEDLKNTTLTYRQEQEKLTAETIKARNEKKLSAIEAQKLAKQIQDLKNQTNQEALATKQAAASMKAAAGSYNEANIRAQALLKSIKAAANGFDSTNPAIQNQVKEYRDLNAQLLKFEQQLGINYRNVGNYRSGFNGLTNSINQLSREAPAFANSIQTGLLGISNNLPILFDELQKVKQASRELNAEGKKGPSVFQALTGAIFSLQTALSLGITLLVVYGPKLFELAKGLFSTKEAFNQAAEAIKITNEAMKSDAMKSAIADVISLKQNVDLAKKGFITKEAVVDQYNETIGKATGQIKTLDQAESFLVKSVPAYLNMMYLKTAAQLAQTKAAEVYLEQMATVQERERVKSQKISELNKKEAMEVAQLERLRNADNSENTDRLILERKQQFAALRKQVDDRSLTNQIIDQEKTKNGLLAIVEDTYAQAAQVAKDNNFDLFLGGKEGKDIQSTIDRLKEQASKFEEAIKESLAKGQTVPDSLLTKLDQVNKQIENIEKDFFLLTNPDLTKFTPPKAEFNQDDFDAESKQLESAKSLSDMILEIEDKQGAEQIRIRNQTITDAQKFAVDNQLNYQEVYLEYLQSGYKSFEEFEKKKTEELKTQEEGRLAIRQAAIQTGTELVNAFYDLSKMRSEQDLAAAQAEYDYKTKLAGDNASARTKAENDYRERANAIRREQAKKEKDDALFNIAIQTAVAGIRAIAEFPGPVGFLLAAIAGAEGIIQAAVVSARPLPQFYKGVESSPEGFALVGEKGREIIESPSGQMRLTGDKAEVQYLEKGSKVYTHQNSERMLEQMKILGSSPYGNNFREQQMSQNSKGISKQDMKEVMRESMSSLPLQNFVLDEKGYRKYTVVGGRKLNVRNVRAA